MEANVKFLPARGAQVLEDRNHILTLRRAAERCRKEPDNFLPIEIQV